jgi:HPt (histidine-containing phosphotransfer) domain-containing protein
MNDHVGKPFDMNHLVAVLLNVSGYQATESSPGSAIDDVEMAVSTSKSNLNETGIDVEGALGRMSGMRTLYTRLVGDFLKALDSAAQEFERLLAIPSLLEASRHAHTLKGTASTLGATQLAKFASELETLCKTETDSGVILKQSPALAEVVRSTQTSLRQVLAAMLPPATATVITAKQGVGKASPAEVNTARQAIAELTGLLKNADLAALQRLAELRDVLAAVVPDALESLEGAMQGLELEDAQKICQEIADSLDLPSSKR